MRRPASVGIRRFDTHAGDQHGARTGEVVRAAAAGVRHLQRECVWKPGGKDRDRRGRQKRGLRNGSAKQTVKGTAKQRISLRQKGFGASFPGGSRDRLGSGCAAFSMRLRGLGRFSRFAAGGRCRTRRTSCGRSIHRAKFVRHRLYCCGRRLATSR
jgi:hypothetical protein